MSRVLVELLGVCLLFYLPFISTACPRLSIDALAGRLTVLLENWQAKQLSSVGEQQFLMSYDLQSGMSLLYRVYKVTTKLH